MFINVDAEEAEMVGKAKECQEKTVSTSEVPSMLCSNFKQRINFLLPILSFVT